MKKGKLKALAPLLALAALLALGTAVYPMLSDQTLRQNAPETTQAPEPTQAPEMTQELETTNPPESVPISDAQDADETPEAETTPEVAGPAYKPMAKDFTVYDAEGNAATLAEKRGKPVLVNFFASWCGPCRQEMPALDAAYRAHGGEIEFMMIDLYGGGGDDPEAALALRDELGCAFPVLFDTDGGAAAAYGVRAIPTTLLVAPDGELLETQVGTMTEAAVSQKIERLLSSIE